LRDRDSERSHWYKNMHRSDRNRVDIAAKWLSPIPWQWFVTLTFPWNVRAETADAKLIELFNLLEKHHHEILGAVIGKESRSRHDGSRVPWHFHLLITSNSPVSKEAIESVWIGLIRNRSQVDPLAAMTSEHVEVKPYCATALGTEYCLKMISKDDAEWDFHRMDCFLPRLRGTARPTHRTLRRGKRANLLKPE
jgi:hypothetical protein